jgi:hypothetical protein
MCSATFRAFFSQNHLVTLAVRSHRRKQELKLGQNQRIKTIIRANAFSRIFDRPFVLQGTLY